MKAVVTVVARLKKLKMKQVQFQIQTKHSARVNRTMSFSLGILINLSVARVVMYAHVRGSYALVNP